jgi:4-hydroxybenzoate polyprenyltransferase
VNTEIENNLPTSNQQIIKDYLALIRLKFHTNFSFVLLGTISFAQKIDVSLLISILVMYVSFNICLYGGIYTVNAITDLEKDAKHSRKKNRPLPSGRISKSTAIILAISLIMTGLLFGFLYFGKNIGFIYLAFIAVNLFYSLFARNIPFLELFVNATTMPLRLLMGSLLAVDSILPTYLMFGAYCTGIGFLAVRRIVEKDIENWQEGRPALKAYQGNIMLWLQIFFFAGLLLAVIFDPLIQQDWIAYAVMVTYFAIFCLGTHIFEPIRSYWRELYGN